MEILENEPLVQVALPGNVEPAPVRMASQPKTKKPRAPRKKKEETTIVEKKTKRESVKKALFQTEIQGSATPNQGHHFSGEYDGDAAGRQSDIVGKKISKVDVESNNGAQFKSKPTPDSTQQEDRINRVEQLLNRLVELNSNVPDTTPQNPRVQPSREVNEHHSMLYNNKHSYEQPVRRSAWFKRAAR